MGMSVIVVYTLFVLVALFAPVIVTWVNMIRDGLNYITAA